jgi:hypothetical protein
MPSFSAYRFNDLVNENILLSFNGFHPFSSLYCEKRNKLFPARESLVSDIPSGDGKTANLFSQCIVFIDYYSSSVFSNTFVSCLDLTTWSTRGWVRRTGPTRPGLPWIPPSWRARQCCQLFTKFSGQNGWPKISAAE